MSYGKWILVGEHAVLRGGDALAFPLSSHVIKLDFEWSDKDLQCEFYGEHYREISIVFWSLLERALKFVQKSRSELKGLILLTNAIPLGCGLGASAALCVLVGKWFCHLGWLEDKELFSFACHLEDLFHGESSGLDIAASLADDGVLYSKERGACIFSPQWMPNYRLTYSGNWGMTLDCVEKVKALGAANPQELDRIDGNMRQSVEMAVEALSMEKALGFPLLIKAIEQAAGCFEDWGLITKVLAHEIDLLSEQGAIAIKPTGAGGGGYILSLWSEEEA